MSILVVVAHPDDEALGCGATVAAATSAGSLAHACILSASAAARRNRPPAKMLLEQTVAACESLGMTMPILGDFTNLELNTVPHVELVQFVESAIEAVKADTIITHHPADLNDDHLQVSRACQVAATLCRRRSGVPKLRALYFMEILSSTDWAFATGLLPFRAEVFIPVTERDLERKIAALMMYEGVMRDIPHSRSVHAVRALATMRGVQAHTTFAEAFQLGYLELSPQMLVT